jgi:hypothetical protein
MGLPSQKERKDFVDQNADLITETTAIMIELQSRGVTERIRFRLGKTWIAGFVKCPDCGQMEATVNQTGTRVRCMCGFGRGGDVGLRKTLEFLGVYLATRPPLPVVGGGLAVERSEAEELFRIGRGGNNRPQSGGWGDVTPAPRGRSKQLLG